MVYFINLCTRFSVSVRSRWTKFTRKMNKSLFYDDSRSIKRSYWYCFYCQKQLWTLKYLHITGVTEFCFSGDNKNGVFYCIFLKIDFIVEYLSMNSSKKKISCCILSIIVNLHWHYKIVFWKKQYNLLFTYSYLGTLLVIYNLKLTMNGEPELDILTDEKDILIGRTPEK